jgi:hypothetical protein
MLHSITDVVTVMDFHIQSYHKFYRNNSRKKYNSFNVSSIQNNTYPKTCARLYDIKYPFVKLLSSRFDLLFDFDAITTSINLLSPENKLREKENVFSLHSIAR